MKALLLVVLVLVTTVSCELKYQHHAKKSDQTVVHRYSSNSRSLCPNDCSGHGTCQLAVCQCDEDYFGWDCSIHGIPATSGTWYPTSQLEQGLWLFYGITVPGGAGVRFDVTSTEGDVDMYIQRDSLPSRISYYAKDVSRRMNFSISVLTPEPGKWYAGLYSYATASFNFRASVTSQCLNDCSGHGSCIDGVCSCDANWASDDCSKELHVLQLDVPYSGSVLQANFEYFIYTPTSAPTTLTWVLTVTSAPPVDADLFVSSQNIPSQWDYEYSDISTTTESSLVYDIETLVPWYGGVYGFTATTYTLVVHESSSEDCINQCSLHGTCSGTVCNCQSGFDGDLCEDMVAPMQNNQLYSGFVDTNMWNYYFYPAFSANNLLVTITQMEANNADCDLYIKMGSKPTRFDFDYQHIGYDQTFTIEVEDPSDANWYFGVYGWRTCSYNIRVVESTGCTAACDVHGQCVGSQCVCDSGWAGDDCAFPLSSLTSAITTSATVTYNTWVYYSFTYSGSAAYISLKELTGNAPGLMWLYVGYTQFPDQRTYDLVDTSRLANHRLEVTLPQETGSRTVYIGVYGSPYMPTTDTSYPFKLVAWSPPY